MNRLVAVLLTSVIAVFAPATVASAASTKRYVGAVASMKFGRLSVTITVNGKKILNVTSILPTERPRSKRINDQAGPLLRREVLQAQSARINVISGATYTSFAYAQSLQSALDKAHL